MYIPCSLIGFTLALCGYVTTQEVVGGIHRVLCLIERFSDEAPMLYNGLPIDVCPSHRLSMSQWAAVANSTSGWQDVAKPSHQVSDRYQVSSVNRPLAFLDGSVNSVLQRLLILVQHCPGEGCTGRQADLSHAVALL